MPIYHLLPPVQYDLWSMACCKASHKIHSYKQQTLYKYYQPYQQIIKRSIMISYMIYKPTSRLLAPALTSRAAAFTSKRTGCRFQHLGHVNEDGCFPYYNQQQYTHSQHNIHSKTGCSACACTPAASCSNAYQR